MAFETFLRGLPLAILTIALVAVPVLVLEPQGMPRMRGLESDLQTVRAENVNLERDIARLRLDVKELRDDPAAVERTAREQLGLVRKSEVVFQFAER